MATEIDEFEQYRVTAPVVGKTPVNNPGALRPVGATTGFMQFPNAQAGQDALHNDLIAKGKRGVNTVEKLIGIWAPPSENNTTAYIAAVAKEMGIDPKTTVDLNDPVIRGKIATAIQRHEGVVPLSKQATPSDDFAQYLAQSAGSGRGVVNPTAEDIAARVAATPNAQNQILRNANRTQRKGTMPRGGYYTGNPNDPNSTATLSDVGTAIQKGTTDLVYNPATEGFARGITAGGYDYGKAALMPTTTNTLTFKDKLADVRARRAEQERQFPISSGIGNVAGAVTLGALTGGTSLPGQMATTGVIGGVNKFTESPDTTMNDAMNAGLINAGAAGVFGVAGKGFDMLTKNRKNAIIKQYADEAGVSLKEARRDVRNNMVQAVRSPEMAAGVSDVARGSAWDVLKTAGATASPVIGSVAGGYTGGQIADLLGADHNTGVGIGGLLGGGGASVGAWKAGVLQKAAKGTGDTLGMLGAVAPKAGRKAAPKIAGVTIPAVSSAAKSIKDAYTDDPLDEFSQYRVD